MMKKNDKISNKVLATTIIAGAILGGCGINNNAKTTGTVYKNGSYSAVGNYVSPDGPQQIGVNLTLNNGVVSAVLVEPKATAKMSLKWQTTVKDNIGQYVMGKNINDLNLDKIAGSSLTPKAFNEAISLIKNQAKG